METEIKQISAVVCTMNSAASIEGCLTSLRNSGVGQIVVVDARSSDGTREIADSLADIVIQDEGIGLGNARNQGIAATTGKYVLNCGSDNLVTPVALVAMLRTLVTGNLYGVSALTEVAGNDYVSQSMNDWRRARFRPGPAAVIGTPTLFRGEQIRLMPFDSTRQHSDDAELCERWTREFGARFAISEARILEAGKATWGEIQQRCRNYGFSDYEVFRSGKKSGWSAFRQIKSLVHPARVDLVEPLIRLDPLSATKRLPFLTVITVLRYQAWADVAINQRAHASD